jgi:hypothetical protein
MALSSAASSPPPKADEAAHKPQRTAASLQGMAFYLSIVIR